MKKKLILIITALTLCAAVAVGGTLAYLSDKSETLDNIFTYDGGGPGSKNDVKIEIAEPRWDDKEKKGTDGNPLYQWTEVPLEAVPADNQPGEDGKPAWGSDQGFYDGKLIDKDPTVKNKTQVKTYVGVTVTLSGALDTWAEFDAVATFKTADGKSLPKVVSADNRKTDVNGWTLVNEEGKVRYYVYNTALAPNNKDTMQEPTAISNPLFSYVYIDPEASPILDAEPSTPAQQAMVKLRAFAKANPTLSALQLDITAYATQATLSADVKDDQGATIVSAADWNADKTNDPAKGAQLALGTVFKGKWANK